MFAGLVLVVSEVRTMGYGAERVRTRSARGEAGVMGRPKPNAAVGVAEENTVV